MCVKFFVYLMKTDNFFIEIFISQVSMKALRYAVNIQEMVRGQPVVELTVKPKYLTSFQTKLLLLLSWFQYFYISFLYRNNQIIIKFYKQFLVYASLFCLLLNVISKSVFCLKIVFYKQVNTFCFHLIFKLSLQI